MIRTQLSPGGLAVALEVTPKKSFAIALDWPGWSRAGKTRELALEVLASYAPRYAEVAELAGQAFPSAIAAHDFDLVEEAEGDGGTAFGVPSRVTDADRRPTSAAEAGRLRALVAAAWATFDRVAVQAPAQLRKGPRGRGRDRDKMIGHVLGADDGYAREIGLRLPPASPGDRASIEAVRAAVLDNMGAPSDGSPIAGRRWTARYAASRIAWHALDHAWEMEDRAEP